MKSFADWTQEIAESQNHEPEPAKELASVESVWGAPYNPPAKRGDFSADEDDQDHIKCSGAYCEKYGAPNYGNGDEADEYYCGGSPRCCP